MHIREFQNLMKDLYFERDINRGLSKTFLWIIEEVGELAEALRTYQEQNQSKNKLKEIGLEIADVIAWVASLANILKIDLESVLTEKYPYFCPKCHQNPCNCDLK
ncbi:MAG: MazG nucleotide pyrophosphohydrolase domain-containing protein [Candidatus Helarchaeota archaeon]